MTFLIILFYLAIKLFWPYILSIIVTKPQQQRYF